MDSFPLLIEFVAGTSIYREPETVPQLPIVQNGPPGTFVIFADARKVPLPTDQIVFADDTGGRARVGFGGMSWVQNPGSQTARSPSTPSCSRPSSACRPKLARQLRAHLQTFAPQRLPITYPDAAKGLLLTPPNTIHQVTEALKQLMADPKPNVT